MGNYRFKLSDMMPNAWFYKLRDMSRTRNHSAINSHPVKKKLQNSSTQKPNHLSHHRQSHYYTTESERSTTKKVLNSPRNSRVSDTRFPDPPRRSSKRRTNRKTIYKPSPHQKIVSSSVSDGCTACHNSVWLNPQRTNYDYLGFSSDGSSSTDLDFLKSLSPEFDSDGFAVPKSCNGLASWSSSCSCKFSSSGADIIIDMGREVSQTRKFRNVTSTTFDTMSDVELPPILTRPTTKCNEFAEAASEFRTSSKLENHGSFSVKIAKEENARNYRTATSSPGSRKSFSYSNGVKLRSNSPKLASRRKQGGRKSLSAGNKKSKKVVSESYALVKASVDPQKDFRDSMVEMIVENNIRASKDLEELLACYLSLNSNEYHEFIIKAFEQIWFSMPDLHL